VKRIILSVCFVLVSVSSLALAQTDEIAITPITQQLNSNGTVPRGVSYDGTRIVFESSQDYTGQNADLNPEIFVYDVTRRQFIQVTDTQNITDATDPTIILLNVRNTTPVISGDGTRIVFTSNAKLTDSNNDDGNFEIFLATLPLNSTTSTFLRITSTGPDFTDEFVKEIFSNYSPDVSADGNIVTFLSSRKTFAALDNGTPQFTASLEGPNRDQAPDGNAEVFVYNVSAKTYSQITISRDVDATVNFEVKGFNGVPHVSGNGQVLAFTSGFNYPGTNAGDNADFNGEIFIYKRGDPANSFRQLTNTTGTAAVPVGGSMNLLVAFTRPFNNAGTLLVFESAGDFAGSNADKTREIFLADISGATPTFKQVTNQATVELTKSDYNFLPSINGAGTLISFGSTLNLVPTDPHSTATDNDDASRELFLYDIAASTPTVPIFRQLTFTILPDFLGDGRLATNYSFANNSGKLITFDYVAFLLASNLTFATEIFQEQLLPVTTKNAQAPTLANAASFDAVQLGRGSIAAGFGTMLSNSIASASTAELPYELNGVRVTVASFAARIFFISPGQVNFLLPDFLALGDEVPFSINNNGVQSVGKVKLVSGAPGIFTLSADGIGQSTAQCGKIVDVTMGDTTTPVFVFSEQPCDVGTEERANFLIIYGTGWHNESANTSVSIGGESLVPLFVGAQGAFAGLDQINITLTQSLKGKGPVDLIVTSGGIASKTVQVNIQ
jgi:uncharacterized protein (TIGR03437 family)